MIKKKHANTNPKLWAKGDRVCTQEEYGARNLTRPGAAQRPSHSLLCTPTWRTFLHWPLTVLHIFRDS